MTRTASAPVLMLGLTLGCSLGDASIGDPLDDEVGSESGSESDTGPEEDDDSSSTNSTGEIDSGSEGDSTSESDSTGESEGGPPPEAPVLELSYSPVKQFDFDWAPARGAEFYRLLERSDVDEPWVEVGEDVLGLETSLVVPLHLRLNASYKLRACNTNGCTDSEAVNVMGPLVEAIGYFKASNTETWDEFGSRSLALSDDGNTLAVGAIGEDSSAVGIDGDQADNSASFAGAVYVFVRDGQNGWSQQAYVKASNTEMIDYFGGSVVLSADGNTMVVSARLEDSGANGIDGNQSDNSASAAGAAYVFVRDDQNEWSQQAYLKASNSDEADSFGMSMALSNDGNTLAVGASDEDSGANGIDGNQADDSTTDSGAVYVFVRDGQNEWSQQAYVKPSNSPFSGYFGYEVGLSGDGNTLAVAAPGEYSSATGIDGNQAQEPLADTAGAVYVFVRDGQNEWSQQAYVKASNTAAYDEFGQSVALSDDGNTLAVGAWMEDGSAIGIGGNQASNAAEDAGAVYVFVRDDRDAWSQQAYVKASNTGVDDRFGQSLALADDGNLLAVTASREDSDAIGIGGDQVDDAAGPNAGAVYVFVRDQSAWSQRAYVKASNTGGEDYFGVSLALSENGDTLAIGAAYESSSALGIGGNQADESAEMAGAVYLY